MFVGGRGGGGGGGGNIGNNVREGNNVGVSEGGGAGGLVGGQIGGGGAHGVRDESGLNRNRIRGFGVQHPAGGRGARVETPTLNEMKAKQGAIVAKFMTFFRRKSTCVIEMYEQSFYKQKPTWDKIADFVYTDLCQMPEMRKEVKDVQFHPVKMLLFVRFSEDRFRDEVIAPHSRVWILGFCHCVKKFITSTKMHQF